MGRRTSSQNARRGPARNAKCIDGGMENSFGLLPHSPSKRMGFNRERLDEERTNGIRSHCLEVSIRADARRLFHALTDPEYLEAWICLPGHGPECSTAAVRNDRNYAIEHFCNANGSVSISGSYRVCRRRNVTFTWRVDGEICVPETQVDIRLHGDFERTTLSLRHSGFVSSFDLGWHRALWELSMNRLASLYGFRSPSGTSREGTKERRGRAGWAIVE